MSRVADRKSQISDEEIDRLLQVREIREAVDEYIRIQREYGSTLLQRIREWPDGTLPDVSDVTSEMDEAMERQRGIVNALVQQHLVQQQWMLR